jgi:hypothetical protein
MCWSTCVSRRNPEGPKLSYVADFEALQKQEVKAKAEVPNCLLKHSKHIPTHTLSPSAGRLTG